MSEPTWHDVAYKLARMLLHTAKEEATYALRIDSDKLTTRERETYDRERAKLTGAYDAVLKLAEVLTQIPNARLAIEVDRAWRTPDGHDGLYAYIVERTNEPAPVIPKVS